jgi:hypothetical protein
MTMLLGPSKAILAGAEAAKPSERAESPGEATAAAPADGGGEPAAPGRAEAPAEAEAVEEAPAQPVE